MRLNRSRDVGEEEQVPLEDRLIVDLVREKVARYEKWLAVLLVFAAIIAIWMLAPGWIDAFNRAPL